MAMIAWFGCTSRVTAYRELLTLCPTRRRRLLPRHEVALMNRDSITPLLMCADPREPNVVSATNQFAQFEDRDSERLASRPRTLARRTETKANKTISDNLVLGTVLSRTNLHDPCASYAVERLTKSISTAPILKRGLAHHSMGPSSTRMRTQDGD